MRRIGPCDPGGHGPPLHRRRPGLLGPDPFAGGGTDTRRDKWLGKEAKAPAVLERVWTNLDPTIAPTPTPYYYTVRIITARGATFAPLSLRGIHWAPGAQTLAKRRPPDPRRPLPSCSFRCGLSEGKRKVYGRGLRQLAAGIREQEGY